MKGKKRTRVNLVLSRSSGGGGASNLHPAGEHFPGDEDGKREREREEEKAFDPV